MSKFLIFFCMIFIFSSIQAQNIEDLVSKYTDENGEKFMQPVADILGSTINSGLNHTAKIKKNGFQLYIGLNSMVAFVPDKLKTFEAVPEGMFEPKTPVEVPTIVGESNNVAVSGTGGTTYLFPGGLNLKYLPYFTPQLTIGSVMGTNLTIRYLGFNTTEDIGRFSTFGWGINHSISQYIATIPVDLAIGLYNQYFSIGDIVSTKTWLFDAQVSYNLLLFTFYGNLGYETSKLNAEYTYESDGTEETISFDLKAKNNISLTTGVTFNLGPVRLFTNYKIAYQSVLTVGLGFGIGDK